MKRLISITLVFFLLFSLCACDVGPSLVGSNSGDNNSNNNSSSANAKTFKVGDSVELKGVVVTFLGVTENTGSTYNKPEDGNVFVLCEFEIVNNSKEELAVSSIMSFKAYCDDYACDLSFGALMEKGNKDQLDGSVAAGKKMKGVVGYEVPANWKELEVQYSLNILYDDMIVFIANNN